MLLIALVAACGKAPVYVGDGFPHVPSQKSVVDVAMLDIDSLGLGTPIRIEPWSVPADGFVEREMEQAVRFSQSRNLVAVVGHSSSRDALLAASVYNSMGVPQIVPAATSHRLRLAGPWTFPLAPADDVEADFIAAYALDSLHASRIAILYAGDEYGVGIRDGLEGGLRRRRHDLVGQALVPKTPCVESDSTVLRQIVVALMRRTRPDVIVLAVGEAYARCAIPVMVGERSDIWILGADNVDPRSSAMQSLMPRMRGRLRAVSFWSPAANPESVAFADRAQRVLGRAPRLGEALVYDAFRLAAAAVREGGGTREGVAKWLRSLGRERKPFPGVTGPIDFTGPRRGTLRMISAETGSQK